MKHRRRSSSLRARILSLTLLAGLAPLGALSAVIMFGLREIESTAERGTAEAQRLLVEQDVIEPGAAAALDALSADLSSTGRQLSAAVLVLLLGGAITSLAMAAVVTRSTVGSIARLTAQSREAAQQLLRATFDGSHDAGGPHGTGAALVAVVDGSGEVDGNHPVHGSRELADLARSVESVQAAALRLARMQAARYRDILETFGQVGRRQRELATRQIRIIDELELREDDAADRLVALSELRELATRVRRSTERVLVIAGTRPPRPHSAAVRMQLVVEGAVGQVSEVDRVDIVRCEPAGLAGHVVHDAGHLIAELVDNALGNSAPDTRVEVFGISGALHYSIRVVDRGVGIDADDLMRANDLLRRGGSRSSSPSGELGLLVVAKLAASHGIAVSLGALSPHGIEARIDIPTGLLQPGAAVTGLTSSTELRVARDTLRLRRNRPPGESRTPPPPPGHRHSERSEPHSNPTAGGGHPYSDPTAGGGHPYGDPTAGGGHDGS